MEGAGEEAWIGDKPRGTGSDLGGMLRLDAATSGWTEARLAAIYAMALLPRNGSK